MTHIFISYRRNDTAGHSARLFERLVTYFDPEDIFFDVSTIESGESFADTIEQNLRSAQVILVVIGPDWLSVENRQRLEQDTDYVRCEVMLALQRRDAGVDKDVGDVPLVIPLLVGGATQPNGSCLPECLRPLAGLASHQLPDSLAGYEQQFSLLCHQIDNTCQNWIKKHNQWMREGLSDKRDCVARFGQDLAVLSAQTIQRKATNTAMDQWWANCHRDNKPFVLLGEEGDGKTWALAAWVAQKLTAADFSLPVVWLPANKVANNENVINEIAKGLNKAAANITVEAWEKRLGSHQSLGGGPGVLLIVDGLNERDGLDWRVFLDQCLASQLNNSVTVIVSCRRAWWDTHMGSEYQHRSVICQQQAFDDNELSQALNHHQLRLADFSDGVVKLMAKPRYFDMAVKLKNQLAGVDDVTIDRLIYEDWRDMTQRKRNGSNSLSHDDFLDLITGLASKYQNSMDRRTWADELSTYGDQQQVYAELLSSGIIQPSDRRGQFKVAERPMILGLGLLLADEVKASGESDYQAIEELIAKRLGDHSIDLVGQICAMALFEALLSPDYPDMGRIALFLSWVAGRNFDSNDIERMRAYFPLRPHIYFQVAQRMWSGQYDNREVQDHLMRAFVQPRHFEQVKPAMVDTFERWLGLVQPLGYRGAFEKDEQKLKDLLRQFEKRLGQDARLGNVDVLGCPLLIIEDMNQLRLGQVAASVISHFDRQAFVNAIIRGIVAKILMAGSHTDWGWLLRTASRDVHQLLIAKAEDFIACNEPLAFKVAYRILSDVCSEQAVVVREAIPAEYHYQSPFSNKDPCDFPLSGWSGDNYQECVLRKNIKPMLKASRLQFVALNPLNTLDDEQADSLVGTLEAIDFINIYQNQLQTRDELLIKAVEAALCAYQPDQYLQLVKSMIDAYVALKGEWHYCDSCSVYKYLPVMLLKDRKHLLNIWRLCLNGSRTSDELSEMILFAVVTFNLTPSEQLALVVERGDLTNEITGYGAQFTKITVAEIPALINEIKIVHKVIKPGECLLSYLSQVLSELDKQSRGLLLDWFHSGDTSIRGFCLCIFSTVQDSLAAKEIIAQGWRAKMTKESLFEDEWGSVLLSDHGHSIPFSSLAKRIMPKYLGYAWQMRGQKQGELRHYGRLVHQFWLKIPSKNINYEQLLRHVRIVSDSNQILKFASWDTEIGESQTVRSASFAWGGRAGSSQQGLLDGFTDLVDQKTARDTREGIEEKIADFYKAQQSAGNHWSNIPFEHGHLSAILDHSDEYWPQWLAPVLDGSIKGQKLILAAQGFYEQLCAALLNHQPELGRQLYNKIIEVGGCQIIDQKTSIRTLFFAPFKAKASEPVLLLRRRFFEKCESNHDLLELVLVSELSGQADWLAQLISSLLDSVDDFDNARGLQLLGFSVDDTAQQQLQAWINDHGGSWVKDVAKNALNHQQRNQWAKAWLTKFATHADTLHAWTAFRLFLKCIDRRYWLWQQDFARQYPLSGYKEAALAANQGIIVEAIKENEKTHKLRDRLVNHEIKHHQLWPWMKRYQ